MAEQFKITKEQGEDLDSFGRAHSDKLQALGRSLVSSLYMLVRSVKMYDPDNSVFEKPLAALQETINGIITKEGHLELTGVKDSFYLNNMLVKVDLSALDNTRFLLSEMREKDVGGFSLHKPVALPELKNFVWIFSKETVEAASEDGLAGKKLLSMKVAQWSKIREKLAKEEEKAGEEAEGKVDRKKYAMTVYARAVFYLNKYMESIRAGKPMNNGKALRIVQDFVDICFEQRTHFLGMTTLRKEADYLVFHQVNVCLSSIVWRSKTPMGAFTTFPRRKVCNPSSMVGREGSRTIEGQERNVRWAHSARRGSPDPAGRALGSAWVSRPRRAADRRSPETANMTFLTLNQRHG